MRTNRLPMRVERTYQQKCLPEIFGWSLRGYVMYCEIFARNLKSGVQSNARDRDEKQKRIESSSLAFSVFLFSVYLCTFIVEHRCVHKYVYVVFLRTVLIFG